MRGLDKCSIVLEQRPVRLVTHCRQRRIGLGGSSKRLPDLHFFTPIFVEGNELIGELADRAADVGIEVDAGNPLLHPDGHERHREQQEFGLRREEVP